MNPKFGNIQFLRFLAAVGVVAFHQAGAFINIHAKSDANHFSWGAKGVALFFVISGFVIFTSYSRNQVPARTFAINRLSRILPSYWVLTAIAIVAGVFVHVGGSPANSTEQTSLWRITSFAFISQPIGYSSPVLYQGWSLEYEMFFYAVFALLVALRLRGNTLLAAASGVIAVALLVPGFSFDALGFILGGFVSNLSKYVPKNWKYFDFGVGTFAIVGLISGIVATTQANELVWLLSFAGLLFLAIRVPNLNTKFIFALGSASYPIYLLQWFTIPALTRISFTVLPAGSWLEQLVTIFAAICATTVAGLTWDRFVDQRLSKVTKACLLSLAARVA